MDGFPDDDPLDGSGLQPRPGTRYLWMLAAAAGLALLLFAWWARPWFHDLIVGLLFIRPSILWALFLAGMALLGSALAARSRALGDTVWPGGLAGLAAVLAVVGLIAFPLIGGMYQQVALAERTDTRAQELTTLPEVDPDRPRILPLSVGAQYAQNSLQFPRHQLAGADLTFVNGTPTWSFALRPDGVVNVFAAKQAGAAFVDMTTPDKRIEIVEAEMACGPGMQVTDALDWALAKERYLLDYKDPFYVVHQGELYGAIPFVTYEHRFRFPTVFSVPSFGGVALIDQACEVTVLDPDQARAHPVLSGQAIYPDTLARQEVNSMRYVNGIWNKLFTHEGELELAPVPGEGNDQPFTVPTRDGVVYLLAAEPFGNAQGIFQVWVVDARSGEMGVLRMDPASSLLGPTKASQFLRKDNPTVDWSRMTVSEPLPTVVGERLYWHVKAVPRDSAGIAFTAFVDAGTGTTTQARTVEEVQAFLRSGALPEPAPQGPPAGEIEVQEGIHLLLRNATGSIVLDQVLEAGWRLDLTEGNRTLLVLSVPDNANASTQG